MRPASASILKALERTEQHEDRLTELLACVAQVNARFAASLVSLAGLDPTPVERFMVGTQRGTPGGRRVDMEIAAYEGVTRTKLVWVEAKDGASYLPGQLSDYAEQVRDPVFGEPDGTVLTIVPAGMAPALNDGGGSTRWVTKSWADVAIAADRVGRAAGGNRWRNTAMTPEAPARWRYLAELVERLEHRKDVPPMEPLAPEDVIAAQRRRSLSKALDELRKASRQYIGNVDLTISRGIDRGWYEEFEPTEDQAFWFKGLDPERRAYPQLLYHHEEDWSPDQLGVPAFCAGVTFEKPSKATRYALTEERWVSALPEGAMVVEGVMLKGTGKVLRVVRTKYLSELIVAGATLEEQARALGLWANEAIAEIMQAQGPSRRLETSIGDPS